MAADADFMKLASMTTEYIGRTEPQLQKLAAFNSAHERFVKSATHAAGVLKDLGIVRNDTEANTLVEKLAAAPETVFEIIERMAPALAADHLGDSSNVKTAESGAQVAPWVKAFGGGVESPEATGLID